MNRAKVKKAARRALFALAALALTLLCAAGVSLSAIAREGGAEEERRAGGVATVDRFSFWENDPFTDIDPDPPATLAPGVGGKGDLDGDGSVTARDRTTLARALAGWEGYTAEVSRADLDGDGEVTARDRTTLARALAGWEGVTVA